MLTNISKHHVSLLQIESRDIKMSGKIETIGKSSLWKIKLIHEIDNETINCKQILSNAADVRKYIFKSESTCEI